MDVMFIVNSILIGFVAVTIVELLFMFLKLFFHFRREEITIRNEDKTAILNFETVKHNGNELFLVFEPLKRNKFVTQGSTIEEVSKFIIANYKGKTVFIVEEGKEMIKLFNYTENV